MASGMTLVANPEKMVGMGQIVVARKPTRLTAVLGSCLAVALYCPRLHLGALAHVVLPDSSGQTALPGKFADTAIPHMLQLLAEQGATPGSVIAKIAGGACMFAVSGPMQIGEANIGAVVEGCAKAAVRIAARDVGGTCGRRISFNCGTGVLTVEAVGIPPRML